MKPVLERMGWTKEQFKQAMNVLTAFIESDPYGVVAEFDADATFEGPPGSEIPRGGFRLRMKLEKEFPKRLPFLLGDTLTGLRSTLDYTVWQIALTLTEGPPSSTEFPIFKDRSIYKRKAPSKIEGLPHEAKEVIEGLQPYHAGDEAAEHPLWVLHRLANDYKHRAPHLVGLVPASMGVQSNFVFFKFGAFDDGDEIAVALGRAADEPPDCSFSYHIAFGQGTAAQGRRCDAVIDEAGEAAQTAINALRSFIPE